MMPKINKNEINENKTDKVTPIPAKRTAPMLLKFNILAPKSAQNVNRIGVIYLKSILTGNVIRI